ncbi:related to protein SNF7 [Rhynchosporium secalis]|uniref:Related to protein SNF7 n=1 Tax=Rhynchosporium secalis TaxID=38038 RepID=A0A1E1MR59_RHYSE|nr:related to protein SNF7 [Rhynchosporium secalis]
MSELLTYLLENEPQFRKTRLQDLYSDFTKTRNINPDGYQANITAWHQALSHATFAGCMPSPSTSPDLLSITISNDLILALETRDCGRPSALGTVVREGVKARLWIDVKEFEEKADSIYKKGWGIPVPIVPSVGDVLGWGLRQLGFGGGEEKLGQGRVVVMENLEEAGKDVIRRTEGNRGRIQRIFSRAAFREAYGDITGCENRLTEFDMEILLKFLARDKGVLAYDGEIVKLKAPNQKTPSPVTEEDITIASLKTLIKDLEIQTEVLTKKVDELATIAKEAVGRKNRVSALAALRSKKLAETTLTKRHATLAQLEEIFSKIEQAADQVELVGIMEDSTRVLTGLNKEVGGVARVDDVVDQLREQMSQVDEVGNVIVEAGESTNVVDEGEVDDELEAMERQEREKIEEKERLEKEEKEKKEAAETKRRLDALNEAERQTKETAMAKKQDEDARKTEEVSMEKELEDELKKLSLDADKAYA